MKQERERDQRSDIDLGISILTEDIEPNQKGPEENEEGDAQGDGQAAKALPTAIKLFQQSRPHNGQYSMGSPIKERSPLDIKTPQRFVGGPRYFGFMSPMQLITRREIGPAL